MTLNKANKLKSGDEVFWTDPDNNLTSRYITIQSIEIKGEVVCICGDDGYYIECFAQELS